MADVEILVNLNGPDLDFACRKAIELAKDKVDESQYDDEKDGFYKVERIKFESFSFRPECRDYYGSYDYVFTATLV